jgi:putative ATP-binding cassette transporter
VVLLRLLFRQAPGLVVVTLLLGSLSGALGTYVVALIRGRLSTDAPADAFWAAQLVGCTVGMVVVQTLSQGLLGWIGQSAICDLRLRLSRRLIATPLIDLERLGAHRISAVLSDDAFMVTQAVMIVPMIITEGTIVVGTLGYLAVVMPLTGFLATLVLLVVIVASVHLGYQASVKHMRAARVEQDGLFKSLHSLTSGIKELKLHRPRRDRFFRDDLEPAAFGIRRKMVVSMALIQLATNWAFGTFLFLAGTAFIWLPRIVSVEGKQTAGLVFCLLYLSGPILHILESLGPVTRANIVFQNSEKIGLSMIDEPPGVLPVHPASSFSSIELKGAMHSYQSDADDRFFTLGPVNLTIHPGEIIFVIGGNGSGKSTLAKMITGLYLPASGTLVRDGEPIDTKNREAYGQLFSAIFPDFHLFEKFLWDGRELDARANQLLAKLRLDQKVSVKEGRLSTTALSHGQRKRLALLTAYLENRPIYVFDEWASDQDPEFKHVFYTDLIPELKRAGRTVIAITHDDRYFGGADRIVRLEDGACRIEDPLRVAREAEERIARTS